MEQFKLQKILKMGNSVSDFLTSELFLATFSLLWVLAILYGFIKFVLWRLWGSTATCRKAIQRSEKKRQDGFAEWRQMSETMDENKLGKYKEITDLPLFELRDALQSDNYTAVQVLEAYVWKMLQVHDRLNCCTEVIKEAFDTAKDADEEWHGKPNKPPLYGVPFSVKSNFHMRGYDCCVGLAKWLEQPLEDECTFVTFLKALGGVPFVLTNVPQGLLSFVCSNSVYGTTKNPHDLLRSPGGSSGGEAALLAGGGSPFGIGSDLAGSLRIPASFCGVVALKPTQDRFVVSGSHGGVPGRGRIGLSFGYFTKTVDEQISLLKMTVGKQEYRKITPLSPLLPLNEQTLRDTRPLRIGYFDSDGFCAPVPSMKRAVLETVEKLKSKGHILVKFEIPDIDEAATLFYKLLMPDGGAYYRALYDNDIVDIYLRQFATLLKVPRCLRWMVSHLVARLSPQLALICRAYVSDLPDLRYTQEMCDEYRLKFIDYWQSLGLDALVCPAFPVAPVPHEYPSKLSIAAFATGFFNLVDFPAGVVPAGRVTHDDDRLLMDEKEFPCGYNLALRIQKDSNLTSVGLPCSVQIAALPFEEEVCLRVMKEVEEAWTQQLTKTE